MPSFSAWQRRWGTEYRAIANAGLILQVDDVWALVAWGRTGMAPAESEALLQTLYDHITEARFQYRFKWPGAGTLLLWDNRCTMHSATTKTLPADKFRTLYRISTLGDAPYS